MILSEFVLLLDIDIVWYSTVVHYVAVYQTMSISSSKTNSLKIIFMSK